MSKHLVDRIWKTIIEGHPALGVMIMLTAGLAWAGGGSDETTTTPITHVVVIFDENNSFDHYFGTYPVVANPPGEPVFNAAPGTPTVNGLTPALLA